ncbi:Phosphoribosylformimino-5-aminoimidazole carboxamide ribotide isomerase [Mycena alexandri]|uniref:1-(5-phosphoribosyl)-5-[(5-phosphoribosylamino)methylideneamino] imidazole-4-carboxamide isomerase n=1 Tax=Mycena alexandri TaxID=1745969 RepID=A0AAD6XGK6_9AGAR|nr:Phosphoribosylformimino-5-aminoimidazole carboxamide ribotide isomerase [Mycena alexandri]
MSRSRFRPCIDLHDGQVKQIIGGTLSETAPETLKTNFVSRLVYNNLEGGHVIKLGPGNDAAARDALSSWPGGLQIGGGINVNNAQEWLDAGASKVIVTSYLFPEAKFSLERLEALSSAIGKDKLVVDVSCRKRGEGWFVAMNKWQDITDMEVTRESLNMLSKHCSEFLIHAADVEGLCQGIDEALVTKLGEWIAIPCHISSYLVAGIDDLDLVHQLSGGKVDLTYGSSLDIFGGSLVVFADLVAHDSKS